MSHNITAVKSEPKEEEVPASEPQQTPSTKRTRRFNISLLFQQSEVGPIIGKSGANIKYIKSQSGCHLNFYDQSHRNRTLVIFGEKEQIPYAVELVATALKDDEMKLSASSNINNEKGDRVSLFWILPRSQAIGLIGKGGANAKRIKNETNVTISVLFGEDQSSPELLVRLTGLPQELSTAMSISINEFIKDNTKNLRYSHRTGSLFAESLRSRLDQPNRTGNNGALRYTSPKYRGPEQFKIESTQTIQLTRELAGAVIGKGGGNINRIRSLSGASIKINTPEKPDDMATVIVVGRPSNVAIAFELIETCIQIFLAHGVRLKAASVNGNGIVTSRASNNGQRRSNKGKSQQAYGQQPNEIAGSDTKENIAE